MDFKIVTNAGIGSMIFKDDDVNIEIAETGTTTGINTKKLIDSTQTFLSTVEIGMSIKNTTDFTYTFITAVDSDTQLSIRDDIFTSGENYTIRKKSAFAKAENILNNIYLSIMVRKGSFFFNTDFGSRLHLLKKLTNRNVALAKDYLDEALQWILDTGKAKKIETFTEKDLSTTNRLNILVIATQANDIITTFETFVEVV